MRPYSDLSAVEQNNLVATVFILAALIDLVNGFLIEKLEIKPSKTGYIRFHQEHDVIKTAIFKCCTLIIFIDITYSEIRNRFSSEIFSFIYLTTALWYLVKIVRSGSVHSDPTHSDRFRDRIATIFIDPFLKINDQHYSVPDKKTTWSWWGFFIPELWLLWNEIYGLGLLLIGFYFFVYPHVPFSPFGPFGLWGTIRIIIGWKGQLLIEAKKSNSQA